MNKIITESYPYVGQIFKDEDDNLILNIQDLWVRDSNGVEGKIKCVGSFEYREHGFSGSEDRYNFVDRNLNFRALENKEEFMTQGKIKIYNKRNPLEEASFEKLLKVNGMNGTFYYDKPETND